jgi:predicted ATPase/transcriptional regulator with XRE-family HTH domain
VEGRGPVPEHAALSFAGLLRRLRVQAGLTQEELAEAAGLSPRSISDLERGINQTARRDTARLLADALSLAGPERAQFEAAARGRAPAAEALMASPGVPNNFPLQLTTFVGREDDIAGVRGALASARLVTLVGAGGVGKTRLSLRVGAEVLDDFRDGAWVVDLAGLSDPALVPVTVADAVGVRQHAARPVADSLVDHLIPRQLLVILDNCEHLVGACAALIFRLLSSCPGLKVLATSREALNVAGEVVWRVRSLAVPTEPTSAEALGRIESVRLFVDRARSVRPGLQLVPANAGAVAQICRRLDGVPLAIELAAARVRATSVATVAAKLDDRFRLLTGGSRAALPRQQTMEATVWWSYLLLSEPERILFNRLSVFAGGFTMEAAELVCCGGTLASAGIFDLLTQLVDRSLAVADETADGLTRYRMLETLRQFGHERLLESGETEALRGRHLSWAVTVAESAPPQSGPLPAAELTSEEDNLRAALEWAIETGHEEEALRITGSAWLFQLEERVRLFDRLLPPSSSVAADLAGKALFAALVISLSVGNWSLGAERGHLAVQANRAASNGLLTALSLLYEGGCAWGLGDEEKALKLLENALVEARAAASTDAEAKAHMVLAWMLTERDLGKAQQMATDGQRLAGKLADVFNLGHTTEVLGFVYCLKGELERGARELADAASLFHHIQLGCCAHALETCASWAAMAGRFELGAELWGAADRIRTETADKPRPWERAVQERWLPLIAAKLASDTFDAAKQRGRAREVEEALNFAARALRA